VCGGFFSGIAVVFEAGCLHKSNRSDTSDIPPETQSAALNGLNGFVLE
jgi:hypothetical protein